MTTNISTSNNHSGFILRRPLITSNGFTTDLDPTIKKHLTDLDTLLGKHVFNPMEEDDGSFYDSAETKSGIKGAAAKKAAAAAANENGHNASLNLREALAKSIYAKKTEIDERWDKRGLLYDLVHTKENKLSNISDIIDQNKESANLKYEYQEFLKENWNFLSNNQKAIFGFENISDYLLAYAYFKKGISEINALNNFINNRKDGLAAIINYAVISAARTFIQKESLHIHSVTIKKLPYTYNDDEHPLIQKIISSNLSLNNFSFSKELNKIIDNYIYNGKEAKLIEHADIGDIPAEYIPLLIKYIKNSPIPITDLNVNYFLPLFINQIKSSTFFEETDTTLTDEEFDKDFEVEFFEDDKSTVQANVSNVKCAAKLFYSMVVGEELDVFNLVNYFTHKFLIKNRIDIQDPKLRENIQMYVFSNKFTDVTSGRVLERTRPGERQMFYRQVFNIGNGPVTDDMIVNTDFNGLWKTLILEADEYIEKAQLSPNPDSYVSRQNVMQAVEELQYNLSANCTGMATVISPMIYSELNFIVHKIFEHPEVIRQVVPANGTWWRVVETLYASMKQRRLNATVIYNRAKLSHSILSKIATYNPASFEQDTEFSAFISDVNALISTQSIIQGNATKDRGINQIEENNQNGEEDHKPSDSYKTNNTPTKTGNDEWDF
ncbi:MAG: hypothetical protein H0W84_00610 [Bacteroidetes bacterium]|nr:hypothetical protein [Bacteroidota bacterium]